MAQPARRTTDAVLPSAASLNDALRDASPAEVIAAALRTVGRDRLALVSSFGTESAALLKVMADVDPAIPVVFLDTGWLFEETLAYRDTLIAALGLRDIRSVKPSEDVLKRDDPATKANELVAIQYGLFLNTLIKFLIVAWVVFLLVKAVNVIRRREAEKGPPETPPAAPPQESLLAEIRDLLKAQAEKD